MKTFLSLCILAVSMVAGAADKSACIVKYDLLSDKTDAIFYYEVSKYNNATSKFETLKQWYCDEASVVRELPEMLKNNCNLINVDGIAIQPNSAGAFDVSFGCG